MGYGDLESVNQRPDHTYLQFSSIQFNILFAFNYQNLTIQQIYKYKTILHKNK